METAHDLYDRAADAAEYIRSHAKVAPDTAVILGSGLADVSGALLPDPARMTFESIPNFPSATAVGHPGQMLVGEGPGGRPLAVMLGRIHLYEGYTVKSVTFPVRALQLLGVKRLIGTNAAGGVNENYAVGDLMVHTDQMNLTGQDPLVGENDPRLGQRFLDMTHPFDPEMLALAQGSAPELGVRLHAGVYAGLHGPTFETRAEIERLRRLGADAVGMSTVNEVIAARHGGLSVLAFSVISNMAGVHLEEVAEAVMAGAQEASDQLTKLLVAIIARLDTD